MAEGIAAAQQPAQLQQQQQQQQQPEPAATEQPVNGSSGGGQQLPVLLGITNLHFLKMLPQWPNVLSVSIKDPAVASRPGSSRGGGAARSAASAPSLQPSPGNSGGGSSNGNTDSSSPSAAAAGDVSAAGAGAAAVGAAAVPRRAGLLSSTAAAAMRAIRRRRQGPQHLLSDFTPHLWHEHRAWLKPDTALVSSIVRASSGGGSSLGAAAGGAGAGANAAANRLLRRHFSELTAAFLQPFDRYIEPGANGKVPRWRPQEFLASLAPASLHPALTARLAGNSRTAAAALYGAFIASPNFSAWFGPRRQAVAHLLEPDEEPTAEDSLSQGFAVVTGAEAAEAAQPGGSSASQLDEVALVQTFLGLEQQLSLSLQQQQQLTASRSSGGGAGSGTVEASLQRHLVVAFVALPQDLQAALASSPVRLRLLQQCAAALRSSSSGGGGDGGSSGRVVVSSDAVAAAAESEVEALLLQLQQIAFESHSDEH